MILFVLIIVCYVGCNVIIFCMKVRLCVLKNNMVEFLSGFLIFLEFWYCNLVDILLFINVFIEKMVSENFLVKVILIRGYKFFYELYIYDVEGKFLVVFCIEYY